MTDEPGDNTSVYMNEGAGNGCYNATYLHLTTIIFNLTGRTQKGMATRPGFDHQGACFTSGLPAFSSTNARCPRVAGQAKGLLSQGDIRTNAPYWTRQYNFSVLMFSSVQKTMSHPVCTVSGVLPRTDASVTTMICYIRHFMRCAQPRGKHTYHDFNTE